MPDVLHETSLRGRASTRKLTVCQQGREAEELAVEAPRQDVSAEFPSPWALRSLPRVGRSPNCLGPAAGRQPRHRGTRAVCAEEYRAPMEQPRNANEKDAPLYVSVHRYTSGRDGQSHGGVDRPPDHRCLPMERSSRPSHPRPRRVLWSCRYQAPCGDGNRDYPTAPRSPWQNGHAERLIGSIRRECLDHIVVFGDVHLRRILAAYTGYYNELPTRLSLSKGSRSHSSIQRFGQIIPRPILGRLHHEYCRM
jgi:Integrase core domain